MNPFGMVVSQDDDGALGTALNGMTVRKVDRPEGCGFISLPRMDFRMLDC